MCRCVYVWVFWQYVYLYLLCFVLFRLCIFILICSVCTGVRTAATEWQLNCSTQCSSPTIKRPGRESDHSPTSTINVKNEWSFAYTPSVLWRVPSSPFSAFPLTIITSQYPRRKMSIWACRFRYSHTHNHWHQNVSCVLQKGILLYEVKIWFSNFYNSQTPTRRTSLKIHTRTCQYVPLNCEMFTDNCSRHRWKFLTSGKADAVNCCSYTGSSKSALCTAEANWLLIWRQKELKSELNYGRERVGAAK
jgi:hypothetical protein